MLGLSWEVGFCPYPQGIFVVNLRDSSTVSFDWGQDFQIGDIVL